MSVLFKIIPSRTEADLGVRKQRALINYHFVHMVNSKCLNFSTVWMSLLNILTISLKMDQSAEHVSHVSLCFVSQHLMQFQEYLSYISTDGKW